VWAVNPSLDAVGIAATLEGTAADQGVWTEDLAFGTVAVAAAVQRATGGPAPTVRGPTLLPKPKALVHVGPKTAKKTKRTRP
jgi:hypothetical protein